VWHGARAELVPVTTGRDGLREGTYGVVAVPGYAVAVWPAWPSFGAGKEAAEEEEWCASRCHSGVELGRGLHPEAWMLSCGLGWAL